jgi:hypothetical protein
VVADRLKPLNTGGLLLLPWDDQSRHGCFVSEDIRFALLDWLLHLRLQLRLLMEPQLGLQRIL